MLSAYKLTGFRPSCAMLSHAVLCLPQQTPGVHVPEDVTYEDFVRVSKEIMRGRSTSEQREVVAKVLQSLMPEQAPGVFR